MGKVISDITMSVDGFIAGPDITQSQPMGKDGQRLHEWIFNSKTNTDTKILNELIETIGAVIVGNRTYTTAIDDAWGGHSPFNVPALVLCKNLPQKKVAGFVFVIDGINSALAQAKTIAGEKNIWIMGGANIIQQYLKTGLIDELHIHIAPVLLNAGTRLFDHIGTDFVELKKIKVTDTPGATHIQFQVPTT